MTQFENYGKLARIYQSWDWAASKALIASPYPVNLELAAGRFSISVFCEKGT